MAALLAESDWLLEGEYSYHPVTNVVDLAQGVQKSILVQDQVRILLLTQASEYLESIRASTIGVRDCLKG
jgi:hypothetical protein